MGKLYWNQNYTEYVYTLEYKGSMYDIDTNF
jgi:hypothetical protein